ncbi:MAG: peroxiredoxin family protein [Actinomycetota bacterium]
MTIPVGSAAPPVAGIAGVVSGSAYALVFYKVTCPTCQMAAPALERFESGYPGRMIGVGQDPVGALERFSDIYGMTFPCLPDEAPYDASNAYGIEHVPTLLVVDGEGIVADVVESWDRDGYNRASRRLAELLGADAVVISEAADGLPDFRPG